MSVLTAARVVLDEAGEPLQADAIYRRMEQRGLWRNSHPHPEATVAAAICSEIGRRAGGSDFRATPARAFTIRRGDAR